MPLIIKGQQVNPVVRAAQLNARREHKEERVVDTKQEIESYAVSEGEQRITSNANIEVIATSEEQKTLKRNFVIERKKLKGVASAEDHLLVNGRKKAIGRKSKYLLDMLTLEEE